MGSGKNTKTPTLSIQCDWEEVLRKVNGEVWISSKYKDEPSLQGKLKCTSIRNGLPTLSGSDGFVAEALIKEAIAVFSPLSSQKIIVVAPSKIFSTIHNKSITTLSVSTRGHSVSACSEGKLVVWDFSKEELKLTLNGHVGDVYKCKFFPSNKVVLSGGADMQIKVWCAETGVCPVTLRGHKMAVTDLAIIDKGRNIISVSKDGSAKLWDCGQARCLADIIKVNSSINCCDIGVSHSLEPAHQQISDREIGTENKVLIVGCEDGSVHAVAIQNRISLFTISVSSPVNAVAFLSETLFLVACQSGEIFLYNVQTPSEAVKVWFESNSAVLSLITYKDYGFISSRNDGSTVWQAINNDDIKVMLTGPNCDPVYQVVSDGSFIYTCCRDAVIRRYNLEKVMKTCVK